eukprot:8489880-Pyramimonas_sp.AAC.1
MRGPTGGPSLGAAASVQYGIGMLGEWAALRGDQSGGRSARVASAVLLDPLNAFEQVRRRWLLEAAIAAGFPLWQLKPQVDLFCAPKIL